MEISGAASGIAPVDKAIVWMSMLKGSALSSSLTLWPKTRFRHIFLKLVSMKSSFYDVSQHAISLHPSLA